MYFARSRLRQYTSEFAETLSILSTYKDIHIQFKARRKTERGSAGDTQASDRDGAAEAAAATAAAAKGGWPRAAAAAAAAAATAAASGRRQAAAGRQRRRQLYIISYQQLKIRMKYISIHII